MIDAEVRLAAFERRLAQAISAKLHRWRVGRPLTIPWLQTTGRAYSASRELRTRKLKLVLWLPFRRFNFSGSRWRRLLYGHGVSDLAEPPSFEGPVS